jgi:hypothetical protein
MCVYAAMDERPSATSFSSFPSAIFCAEPTLKRVLPRKSLKKSPASFCPTWRQTESRQAVGVKTVPPAFHRIQIQQVCNRVYRLTYTHCPLQRLNRELLVYLTLQHRLTLMLRRHTPVFGNNYCCTLLRTTFVQKLFTFCCSSLLKLLRTPTSDSSGFVQAYGPVLNTDLQRKDSCSYLYLFCVANKCPY